jgi:hypothetical protein
MAYLVQIVFSLVPWVIDDFESYTGNFVYDVQTLGVKIFYFYSQSLYLDLIKRSWPILWGVVPVIVQFL